MNTFEKLKEELRCPPSEYTCCPFWMLNDELREDELIRQIDDFKAHGVDGFIPHPRIGMPRTMPYMSERFLDMIELCVSHAAELGMTVILYDEASYPSGSACGQVVRDNPEFAAKYLRIADDGVRAGEKVVLIHDGITFVQGFTGGTIRGLHPGQDDGEPDAPLAADLLNPAATDSFIRHTHEKYYQRLARYFGSTVIAMFTDEPVLTGRCADMNGKISWTDGFLDDFLRFGGTIDGLKELFAPNESCEQKQIYRRAVRARLAESYYRPISQWCISHGIALTGHPAESGETDVLRYFGIPGQDIVWRWVAPENNLTSAHSVASKCSADAARHLGCRRNLSEVFGACGSENNPWDFSLSDMMWYYQHIFIRGVNLVVPHAFFYSLRTSVQRDDRPPDMGPNNIWWDYYDRISRYIKRMCLINTDSYNHPLAAVLSDGTKLVYEEVADLYKNQIDFNYLDAAMLDGANISGGCLTVGHYRYHLLMLSSSVELTDEQANVLDRFLSSGGKICRGGDFAGFVRKNAVLHDYFSPAVPDLRIVRLTRDGVSIILLANEGDHAVSGVLHTDLSAYCEVFDPFEGRFSPAQVTGIADGMDISLSIQPRVPTVLLFDTSKSPSTMPDTHREVVSVVPISGLEGGFYVGEDMLRNARVMLCADNVREICKVTLNGQPAGELLFLPWKLEITSHVRAGNNSIKLDIIESFANRYGTPIPAEISNARIVIER